MSEGAKDNAKSVAMMATAAAVRIGEGAGRMDAACPAMIRSLVRDGPSFHRSAGAGDDAAAKLREPACATETPDAAVRPGSASSGIGDPDGSRRSAPAPAPGRRTVAAHAAVSTRPYT
jgi:hypothetical protein